MGKRITQNEIVEKINQIVELMSVEYLRDPIVYNQYSNSLLEIKNSINYLEENRIYEKLCRLYYLVKNTVDNVKEIKKLNKLLKEKIIFNTVYAIRTIDEDKEDEFFKRTQDVFKAVSNELSSETLRLEDETYLMYLEKTLEEYKQKTIVRGSNFIFKGSGYRTENILSEIEDEINYIKGKLNREERDRKSNEFKEKLKLIRETL